MNSPNDSSKELSVDLVKKIIDNIKQVFPNIDIVETGVQIDNLKNIAKSIQITTIDADGVKNTTNIAPIVRIVENELTNKQNNNLPVSLQILSHAIAINTQNILVKNTSISNNFVNNIKIKNNIMNSKGR